MAKVDPQCLWFFITTGRGNFCVGADAIPTLFGAEMGGRTTRLPDGFTALGASRVHDS